MERSSQAIVFKSSDFGEADRLVTFFSLEFGKQKGVAKHAKRSKKRFGAGLEAGSLGDIRFVEKRGAELVRIDEFRVTFPSHRITGSLNKIVAVSIALELADKMLPVGHSSRERFELLSRWLNFLSLTEPALPHLHAFFYRWLALSGVAPIFDRCAVCNLEIEASKSGEALGYLGNRFGGIVCHNCHRQSGQGVTVDSKLFDYLLNLKNGKMPETAPANAGEGFENLLIHSVGGKLKSLEVARRLYEK